MTNNLDVLYRTLGWVLGLIAMCYLQPEVQAQSVAENQFYRIKSATLPADEVMEITGICLVGNDKIGLATRRGKIWLAELHPDGIRNYTLFASGLHEPLGLSWRDSSLYCVQRTELTRLRDTNGDNRADVFSSVFSWPHSTNYHAYSYGPILMPNEEFIVSLGQSWIGPTMESHSWYQGWMLRIDKEGKGEAFASGLRSPAGMVRSPEGDVFVTDNQGDWIGSGKISHVTEGDFLGHPEALVWKKEDTYNSSPSLTSYQTAIDLDGTPVFEAASQDRSMKLPGVWLPHNIMGISTTDVIFDTTGGKFGPFAGQMLVGDMGHSKINRVFLEKVEGEYQGACFPFREGFASGVVRLCWLPDGSLLVGMTSRGWSSLGGEAYGLERLTWTGKLPFEIKTIEAQPDGFRLTFTQPVDPSQASAIDNYSVQNFTYDYHSEYGSPLVDLKNCSIEAVKVAADGLSVRLKIKEMQPGYVYEVKASGIRNQQQAALLHPVGYYTLNRIPKGEAMSVQAGSRENHASHQVAPVSSETDVLNSPKHPDEMPASWGGKVDKELIIHTASGLKYDQQELRVKAGSRVRLQLVNPDDMQHNLLICQPGTGEKVGEEAVSLGLSGPARHYVPEMSAVLYHTRLLDPGQEDIIYFTAPEKAGRYDYICSLPGHYLVMNGTLIVEDGP